jgi:hypothetical protein
MNTNLHVTHSQAATMLEAVRFQLYRDTSGADRQHLEAAERMLVAAVCRIQDAKDKRDKKGVWA